MSFCNFCLFNLFIVVRVTSFDINQGYSVHGGWGEEGVAGILYGSTFNIYMIALVQQQN